MPSLEILDISRNKIKRLPSEPGSLVNLRVCILPMPVLLFRAPVLGILAGSFVTI